MTYPEALDLLAYWDTHPPLHLMVQGFLQIRVETKKQQGEFKVSSPDEVRAFIAAQKGG